MSKRTNTPAPLSDLMAFGVSENPGYLRYGGKPYGEMDLMPLRHANLHVAYTPRELMGFSTSSQLEPVLMFRAWLRAESKLPGVLARTRVGLTIVVTAPSEDGASIQTTIVAPQSQEPAVQSCPMPGPRLDRILEAAYAQHDQAVQALSEEQDNVRPVELLDRKAIVDAARKMQRWISGEKVRVLAGGRFRWVMADKENLDSFEQWKAPDEELPYALAMREVLGAAQQVLAKEVPFFSFPSNLFWAKVHRSKVAKMVIDPYAILRMAWEWLRKDDRFEPELWNKGLQKNNGEANSLLEEMKSQSQEAWEMTCQQYMEDATVEEAVLGEVPYPEVWNNFQEEFSGYIKENETRKIEAAFLAAIEEDGDERLRRVYEWWRKQYGIQRGQDFQEAQSPKDEILEFAQLCLRVICLEEGRYQYFPLMLLEDTLCVQQVYVAKHPFRAYRYNPSAMDIDNPVLQLVLNETKGFKKYLSDLMTPFNGPRRNPGRRHQTAKLRGGMDHVEGIAPAGQLVAQAN